jgi:hypothetical protein
MDGLQIHIFEYELGGYDDVTEKKTEPTVFTSELSQGPTGSCGVIQVDGKTTTTNLRSCDVLQGILKDTESTSVKTDVLDPMNINNITLDPGAGLPVLRLDELLYMTTFEDTKQITRYNGPFTIFEKLLCSSSVHGDIIPDGIGFNKMSTDGFNEIKFDKKIIDDKGRTVIEWIKSTAKKHNLSINVFFMDYLDNFIQFRVLLNDPGPSNKILARNIAIKTVAGILAIICITGYYSKDIHPGNVMFNNTKSDNPSDVQIKLIDFGQILQLFFALPASIRKRYIKMKSIFQEEQLFISETRTLETLGKMYNKTFIIFLNKSKFIGLSQDEKRELIFSVIIFYILILGLINIADHNTNSIRCEYFMMYIFNCKPDALSSFTNFLSYFCLDYKKTIKEISDNKLCEDDTLTFDEYKSKCDANIDAICKCITDMLTTSCSWSMARPELLRGIIPDDQLQELNDNARKYTKAAKDAERFDRMRFKETVMYPGGKLEFFKREMFRRHLARVNNTPIKAGSIKKNKHKSRHNRRSNHRNYRSRIRKHNRTSRK